MIHPALKLEDIAGQQMCWPAYLYLLLAETPHSFSLGLCWYIHL